MVIKVLTVAAVQHCAKSLRNKGGTFKVAKVRFNKTSCCKDMPGVEELIPYFKDQVGIVFVDQEAPAVAKVFMQFCKRK